MKVLTFLSIIHLSIQCFAGDTPEPVKVYCFSDALEAGFKDAAGKTFCVQLGKQGEKKNSLTLVESRESADVIAHFVSAEEITERGEAIYFNYGIAWSPNQTKNRRTTVVKVGDFAKDFSGTGINASATYVLIKRVESWIRENRETILAKRQKK
jgi:hypothetical protein